MQKRFFISGALSLAGASFLPKVAFSSSRADSFVPSQIHKPQTVRAPVRYPKGTMVIDTKEMFLYYMYGNGRARRYGVGVGHAGAAWSGEALIGRKAEWPRWTPTKEMLARDPDLYGQFANGIAGGDKNPLGARALYLYQNGKDTLYRIHGTNAPWTIGTAASSGCIRMINDHVVDLYNRIPIGARVIVL